MLPQFILVDENTPKDDFVSADIVVFQFSRREVMAMDVDGAVQRLRLISDDPKVAHNLMGTVALEFQGWTDDQRELFQIPEVVRFFRAVNEKWPYWFYFLHADGPFIMVVLNLLTDPKIVTVLAGMQGLTYGPELKTWMHTLTAHMNRMAEIAGQTEQALAYRTYEVIRAIAPNA